MILSEVEQGESGEDKQARILPFKPEIQHDGISFPAVQSHSKELLANCSRLQERMETNRQNKLRAQQQLSKNYRLLTQRASIQKMSCIDPTPMMYLRQQIIDLEAEHVSLHQQFILQQTQFRQTIKDQRKKLVETINKTRARTTTVKAGVALVANTCLKSLSDNDTSNIDDDELTLMQQA